MVLHAQDAQEPAHAAASVHATVLSEEDVQSEVETDLSSMHARDAPGQVVISIGSPGRPRLPIARSRSGGSLLLSLFLAYGR